MTENGYLIWIIAMAVMTIFVLTVGTLAAADMLAREQRKEETRQRPEADAQASRLEPAAASAEHLKHSGASMRRQPPRPAA